MRGEVQPFDPNASRVGLEYAQDHVDGGRFAGPVGAEEPDDLPAAYVERNPVHGDERTITLA
jgi:hypothetical protein